MADYPLQPAARDRFVLEQRPPRTALDPWRSQGLLLENELDRHGRTVRSATVFLTGRECPWRCLMCDLWQHTTTADTPPGAIAAQTADARATLRSLGEPIAQMKLYNAGSFFDPLAVPTGDYPAIASELAGLDRVIVESHPRLVDDRTALFIDALHTTGTGDPAPALEVAIGLETAHPVALERLNKRMTIADFRAAASRLRAMGADLRVFLLVSPPFVPEREQDEWLMRSVDTAIDNGATVVSLIPTRTGNGALDAVARSGDFHGPSLTDLERSLALGLRGARETRRRVRIFADTWNLDRFAHGPDCLESHLSRLHAMNASQAALPEYPCPHCTRISDGALGAPSNAGARA
ncbi:MAG: radical SAM protein [Vicinamibacterales bacterium]